MGAITSAARDHGLDGDYQWPRPPEGGWTADDLDELPHLPPHTELIDGSLVFVSPRTRFHSRAVYLFEHALLGQLPDEWDVSREMTTKLNTSSSTSGTGRNPMSWSVGPMPAQGTDRPGSDRRTY